MHYSIPKCMVIDTKRLSSLVPDLQGGKLAYTFYHLLQGKFLKKTVSKNHTSSIFNVLNKAHIYMWKEKKNQIWIF